MKLFFSELKKILRRKSAVSAFVFLMAVIPLTALFLLSLSPEKKDAPPLSLSEKDRVSMERLLSAAETKKAALQERYDAGEREEELLWAIDQVNIDRVFFRTALEWDLPVWEYPFLSDLLYDYTELTLRSENGEEIDEAERTALAAVLRRKNYAAAIAFEKERIQNDPRLSEEEKAEKIRENEILFLYDPAGAGAPSAVLNALQEEKRLKNSLQSGVDVYRDSTGATALADADRKDYETYLALLSEKTESGLIDVSYFGERTLPLLSYAAEFAALIFLLLAIRILFREELEGKSIALLFSAPFSKKNVFWAKCAALACLFLAAWIVAYAEIGMTLLLRFPESAKARVMISAAGAFPVLFWRYLMYFLALRFLPLVFLSLLSLLFAAAIPKKSTAAFLAPVLFLSSPLYEVFSAARDPGFVFLFFPFSHFSVSSSLLPQTLEEVQKSALPSVLYLLLFSILFLFAARILFCRKNYMKN